MKNEPDNGYRKPNNCPYCDYFCDAATMTEDKMKTPSPGDLSFCIMCIEACEFDKDMKLIKFDINSIKDIVERNRIKGIQVKMRLFYEDHPKLCVKREKYLKIIEDKK